MYLEVYFTTLQNELEGDWGVKETWWHLHFCGVFFLSTLELVQIGETLVDFLTQLSDTVLCCVLKVSIYNLLYKILLVSPSNLSLKETCCVIISNSNCPQTCFQLPPKQVSFDVFFFDYVRNRNFYHHRERHLQYLAHLQAPIVISQYFSRGSSKTL